MAWRYEQASGRLYRGDGQLVGVGYAGAQEWKNKPAGERLRNRGPIPQGKWLISEPVDTVTHGPHVLPLTPSLGTETYGRGGFLIHGDSVVAPGSASEGCIILSRDVREEIAKSEDRALIVVSGQEEETWLAAT